MTVIGNDLSYDEWAITEFRNEFRFLSNFYPSPLKFSDFNFRSVEHAYQAGKTLDKDIWRVMSNLESPGEAKRLGQNIQLREDWETVKIPLMRNLLVMKFQNKDLKERLLMTNNRPLVEGNTWHDMFWGKCSCPKHSYSGSNHLGELLMEIRRNLNA